MKKSFFKYFSTSTLALAALALAHSASAQTTWYWRGEATSGLWSEANAWWSTGPGTPGGNDILRFNNGNQLTMTNNLSATSRFQIYFDSGSGARTIGGTATNTFYDYSEAAPRIQNDSGNLQTLNFPMNIGYTYFDLIANSGNLVIGGTITANAGATRQITVKGAADTALSGALNQAGDGVLKIWKEGSGKLTLSASNNYSGSTTINTNGGVILVANNYALGTTAGGTTVNAGAALQLSNGITITGEALTIVDDGIGQTGALRNVSGNNTWTGTVSVKTDKVTGNRGGRINSDAGTLTISGNISATTDTTTIYVGGAGNTIFSGTVAANNNSDEGALFKNDSGTLTLSGADANTINGKTTVVGGKLILDKTAGSTALAGAVEVKSPATLLINKSNQIADGSAITLTGGTIERGAGVSEKMGNLTLNENSTIKYGGTAQNNYLQFGTLTLNSKTLTVDGFKAGNQMKYDAADVASGLAMANTFNFTNSDGWGYTFGSGVFTITAVPEASTVIAAVGLAGVLLWPTRRRLLKDAKSILGLRATGRNRSESYRNNKA